MKKKYYWIVGVVAVVIILTIILILMTPEVNCKLSGNNWRSEYKCCCETWCYTTVRTIKPGEPDLCECCNK